MEAAQEKSQLSHSGYMKYVMTNMVSRSHQLPSKKRDTKPSSQFLASHTSLLSFVEVITPQRSYGTAQEGERGDETFIQGLSNHLVDITSLIFLHKILIITRCVSKTYLMNMMPIVEFKIYGLGSIVFI